MKGFTTPQEFTNGFTWYGKQKSYYRGSGDITVGKNKSGWYFTFRNDTFKHFQSGTIEIAITDEAILFRDGGKNGMKLTTTNNPNSRTAKFYRKELDEALRTFAGDYELKYQRQFGIYYITKGEEI